MNPEPVDQIMTRALAQGVFPGAVLKVVRHGQAVFERAYGVRDIQAQKPVTRDTVFDLASLTKALATAPALMLLVQRGRVGLESTLSELLPEFRQGDKKDITLCQLLCHQSGLVDHRPYYRELALLPVEKRDRALKTLLVNEPLANRPGTRVVYSDIGYMILAWVVEACSGMPIDVFVHQEVFSPLGITGLDYIRKDDPEQENWAFASTEHCPWRKKTLIGEVHDDNAWVMGGRGGHAGLFGTADGVGLLLAEYLAVYHGRSRNCVFDRSVLRFFLTEWNSTGRAPGFDMPSLEGSSSGRFFSKTSAGHLGFTGTSFWMDLEQDLFVVLLSNRVHPGRDNVMIRSFRPLIHDAVMENL